MAQTVLKVVAGNSLPTPFFLYGSPGGRRGTSRLRPTSCALWAGPAPSGYPGTSPGPHLTWRGEAIHRQPDTRGAEIVLAAPTMKSGAALREPCSAPITKGGVRGNSPTERVSPCRAEQRRGGSASFNPTGSSMDAATAAAAAATAAASTTDQHGRTGNSRPRQHASTCTTCRLQLRVRIFRAVGRRRGSNSFDPTGMRAGRGRFELPSGHGTY